MAKNSKGAAGKSGGSAKDNRLIDQQKEGRRQGQSRAGKGSRVTARTGAGKSEGTGDNTRSEDTPAENNKR